MYWPLFLQCLLEYERYTLNVFGLASMRVVSHNAAK